MKNFKILKSITLGIFISFTFIFSAFAQTEDFNQESASKYIDTAKFLNEIEGFWNVDMKSFITHHDTLVSQGMQSPFTSWFIVKAGSEPDFRQDYYFYRIDKNEEESSFSYQGVLEPTSLPGLYYAYYNFGGNVSSKGIAKLSPGKLSVDILYPDTIVKKVFNENYDPELAVNISLFCTKTNPVPDIPDEEGVTVTYLDSGLVKVRDNADAVYYRKVKLNRAGSPVGPCTLHYLNGNLMWESEMTYYDPDDSKKDVPDGICRTWYQSGKKESVKKFNDGIITDTSYTWYENGRLKSLLFYKNGTYNGVYRTWFEDGSPEVIAEFSDGNVKGNTYTVFNEDGQEQTIFFENFSNNLLNWPVNDDKEINTSLDDEKFSVISDSKRMYCPSVEAPFDPQWNYEIECTASAENCKTDQFYGIVFGKKDDENFQYFACNNKGQFVAGECANGKMTSYADPKVSESVKTDGSANTLSVRTWGGMVFYSINNEEVYDTFKKELSGKGLGFCSTGKGTFRFDDLSLVVKKFIDPEETQDENNY